MSGEIQGIFVANLFWFHDDLVSFLAGCDHELCVDFHIPSELLVNSKLYFEY